MVRYRNYFCLFKYFTAERHSSYFCDILWRGSLSAPHASTLPKTFMLCVHHTPSVRIKGFPSLIFLVQHCRNISVFNVRLGLSVVRPSGTVAASYNIFCLSKNLIIFSKLGVGMDISVLLDAV